MNIPSIDFYAKLITFLGLGIIIFSANKYFEISKDFQNLTEMNDRRVYSAYDKQLEIIEHQKKYIKLADEKQRIVDSHIKMLTEFNKIASEPGNKSISEIENILAKSREISSYEKFEKEFDKTFDATTKDHNIKMESLDNEFKKISEQNKKEEMFYNYRKAIYDKDYKMCFLLFGVGGLLSFFGLMDWRNKEIIEDSRANNLKIRENLDKPYFSFNCQSCGKAFNSIVVQATDGQVKNFYFCNQCYENGGFKEPTLTLLEMKARTKSYLAANGRSEKESKDILNKIEKLDRWKPFSY